MRIVIQKFGGSIFKNLSSIKTVASFIKKQIDQGIITINIVSALKGHTNKLRSQIKKLDPDYQASKHTDSILSIGEELSAGLLALELNNLNITAQKFSAWQIPIITDNNFGNANIEKEELLSKTIKATLKKGIIPIICGFQGINHNNEITTFGENGSDYTAMITAKALKFSECVIFSEAGGIYPLDPKIKNIPNIIPEITYSTMIQLSNLGENIISKKALEYAEKHNILIKISSFKNTNKFSLIKRSENKQQPIISCIKHLSAISINNVTKNLYTQIQTYFLQNNIELQKNLYDTKNHQLLIIPHINQSSISLINNIKAYYSLQSLDNKIHNLKLTCITLVNCRHQQQIYIQNKIFKILSFYKIICFDFESSENNITFLLNSCNNHLIEEIYQITLNINNSITQ